MLFSDYNTIITSVIGILCMLLTFATTYLTYKLKTLHHEYKLKGLRCDGIYNQLLTMKSITPIINQEEEVRSQTRERFIRLRDMFANTPNFFRKKDVGQGAIAKMRPNREPQPQPEIQEDIYATSFPTGEGSRLYASDTPTMPNIHARETASGGIQLDRVPSMMHPSTVVQKLEFVDERPGSANNGQFEEIPLNELGGNDGGNVDVHVYDEVNSMAL